MIFRTLRWPWMFGNFNFRENFAIKNGKFTKFYNFRSNFWWSSIFMTNFVLKFANLVKIYPNTNLCWISHIHFVDSQCRRTFPDNLKVQNLVKLVDHSPSVVRTNSYSHKSKKRYYTQKPHFKGKSNLICWTLLQYWAEVEIFRIFYIKTGITRGFSRLLIVKTHSDFIIKLVINW